MFNTTHDNPDVDIKDPLSFTRAAYRYEETHIQKEVVQALTNAMTYLAEPVIVSPDGKDVFPRELFGLSLQDCLDMDPNTFRIIREQTHVVGKAHRDAIAEAKRSINRTDNKKDNPFA